MEKSWKLFFAISQSFSKLLWPSDFNTFLSGFSTTRSSPLPARVQGSLSFTFQCFSNLISWASEIPTKFTWITSLKELLLTETDFYWKFFPLPLELKAWKITVGVFRYFADSASFRTVFNVKSTWFWWLSLVGSTIRGKFWEKVINSLVGRQAFV